ncbi:hypothetical protein DPMN_030500 [Dreissena polymorpha]|uniref:Uncharacterized protein n=1 Tax=Dreissena polymorpha TaxID=45954 RepID=A0A9D4RGF8_DREPO|nr:hypothetical protein DPMN_030500 [Dreissena polymorpha]
MKSAKALPRYGSGHKSAGRTDRQPDGQRQNNIPPPLAGDNEWKLFSSDGCIDPHFHLQCPKCKPKLSLHVC